MTKLLLVFILLPICCHGFWNKYYDSLELNVPVERLRRAAENDLSSSSGRESVKPHPGNSADHVNGTHGNGTHGDHAEHVGVHVASWNIDYVKEPLVFCIFIIAVSICKLGFHHAHFLSSIIPESCMLIVLGTAVGGVFFALGISATFLKLSPRLFFLFILPPIILDSAHSLHDRTFIDNLGTILIYAVIGTLLNCFMIGPALYALNQVNILGNLSLTMIECLVFSSLIVAVDPVAVLAIFQEIGVNDVLYFLVFGESLLNDAVTVVIYNMMKTFYFMPSIPPSQMALGFASFFTVSLGGLTIGILFGVFTAFLTKFTKHVRVVEPIAVLVLAYTSYIAAELFHFSGIIATIGCGLIQAQYAFHNIGYKSEITVRYFTKMVSGCNDSIIFLYLGLAMISDHHVWNGWFILWAIILCFVVRFLVVYILTFIANKTYRLRKINLEEQFIMAYGGLRGAVAFSLVNLMSEETFEQRNLFETTTLMIVLFTVFVQGITIKPLVSLLRISKAEKEEQSMFQEIQCHVTDHVMAGVEEVVGVRGRNSLREWLQFYDNHFFKKWLQRDPQTKDDVILQAYQDLEMSSYYAHLENKGIDGPRAGSLWYSNDPRLGFADVVLDADRTGRQARPTSRMRTTSHMSESSGASGGSASRWQAIYAKVRRKNTASSDPESEQSVPEKTNLNQLLRRRENYRQKYDRNLTFEDRTDLLHRLHENVNRKSRLRNSMLTRSHDGSTENFSYPEALNLTRPGLVKREPSLRHSYPANMGSPSRLSLPPHQAPIPEGMPLLSEHDLRARAFSEPSASAPEVEHVTPSPPEGGAVELRMRGPRDSMQANGDERYNDGYNKDSVV